MSSESLAEVLHADLVALIDQRITEHLATVPDEPAPPDSPYMTSQEVADLYGISQRTVQWWAFEGRLPAEAVQPPGVRRARWRFPREAVLAAHAAAVAGASTKPA